MLCYHNTLWFVFWICYTFWSIPNATCFPPWIRYFGLSFASTILLARCTIWPHSPWTSLWKIRFLIFWHRIRHNGTIWSRKESGSKSARWWWKKYLFWEYIMLWHFLGLKIQPFVDQLEKWSKLSLVLPKWLILYHKTFLWQ